MLSIVNRSTHGTTYILRRKSGLRSSSKASMDHIIIIIQHSVYDFVHLNFIFLFVLIYPPSSFLLLSYFNFFYQRDLLIIYYLLIIIIHNNNNKI